MISDITTAGGWTILDCDPNTRIQDVRAVCHSEKCQHLYNGHGAVNTIVRLPENVRSKLININGSSH
jgi:hypothetical protein